MSLTNEDLQAIKELLLPMQQDIKSMQQDLKITQQDVKSMQQDLKITQQDVKGIQHDLKSTQQDVKSMQHDLKSTQQDVKSIQLTLENETNRNIMRVAEGHLDLSRKLDDALKIDNEKELIAIRVNILENELRQIKEHLELA